MYEQSCNFLGILIDSALKWIEHIKYIHNKLIKFVSIFFYKIRAELLPEMLRLIYFAFVHSHLLYGIEIYGNTTANHLSKLYLIIDCCVFYSINLSKRTLLIYIILTLLFHCSCCLLYTSDAADE